MNKIQLGRAYDKPAPPVKREPTPDIKIIPGGFAQASLIVPVRGK